MSKVRNVVLLGVGYVLGSKAGRARYEQLKQQALRVAEHPRTQQLARTARDQVTTRLPGSVTERLPQSVTSRWGTAPSPTSVPAPQPGPAPSPSSVGYPADAATVGRDVDTGVPTGVDREVVGEPASDAQARTSHL